MQYQQKTIDTSLFACYNRCTPFSKEEKRMKEYKTPAIEMTVFDTVDVITVSIVLPVVPVKGSNKMDDPIDVDDLFD